MISPDTAILTEYLSRYSVLIRMFSETDAELALGTGFIYEQDDVYYLVTNGHNITGVNPENGQRLSQHAGLPVRINMSLRIREADSDSQIMLPGGMNVKLYSDEYLSEPTWYMHPAYGHKVDVVAIKIGLKTSFDNLIMFYPINTYKLFRARPKVADDVYVLGYPFGITDLLHLPIWKRGSIASEPDVNYQGLPKVLIDTASRSGMSGSPVIIMRSGYHRPEDLDSTGEPITEPLIGIIYGFLGVYSGRISGNNAHDAQLGIVWKKKVIEHILEAKIIGATDFQHM